MNQTKQIWKNYLVRMAFVFALFGFCFFHKGIYVHAEETTSGAKTVEIVSIDYEEGTIQINGNGNTKVFYSDSKKKTWNEIEGVKSSEDIWTMDISWISAAKNYELNLKGSDEDTVVTVELPKYNSSLKATFDKVEGTVDFKNEEGADSFQWRKATAMNEWNTAPIDLAKNNSNAATFLNEIEALRVKGGKIQIRIPQTPGTKDNVGSRPSKVVTVSVAKRGNAPSVKVVANNLKLSTTNKMEYKIETVGGEKQTEAKWTDCEKNMTLSDIAPQVFAVSGTVLGDGTVTGASVGTEVVVAVRKAETAKAPYSKSNYVTIPAQPEAPDASKFSTSKTTTKFSLIADDASKNNKYQYVVVEAGNTKNDSQLKWKDITSAKEISFNKNKYSAGSVIYVRTKGENLTKKTTLKLPSAHAEIAISYLTE